MNTSMHWLHNAPIEITNQMISGLMVVSSKYFFLQCIFLVFGKLTESLLQQFGFVLYIYMYNIMIQNIFHRIVIYLFIYYTKLHSQHNIGHQY